MSYHANTFDSPNPLIRFAHRKRLETALNLTKVPAGGTLLDYGCGDGLFLAKYSEIQKSADHCIGFEPFMSERQSSGVPIFNDWANVEDRLGEDGVAVVTCFEVLEHLTEPMQADALRRIRRIMNTSGALIVSVPIECGLPSLPKNFFRWLRSRGKSSVYSLKNIAKSLFAIPIPECRDGEDYLSHMGFYYRNLETVMQNEFVIASRNYSPLPALGGQFNSQVFYELKPRKAN
ncbi:MAG: class I SAM-dependent methyltransferase [Pseudomonadota bacterium]